MKGLREDQGPAGALLWGMLLNLGLAAALAIGLYNDREARLASAARQAETAASSAALLVSLVLGNTDRALRGIAADLAESSSAIAGERLMPGLVSGPAARNPELLRIGVFDAAGDAVTDAPDEPGLPTWSAEPWRRTPTGLVLGPARLHADGRWTVPVAVVRVDSPGWIVGHLRLDALQRIIAGVDVGPNGVVTVIGVDGSVLARTRDAGSEVGRLYRAPFAQPRAPPRVGIGSEAHPSDGVARELVAHRLESYPLGVVAGVARADVLETWKPYVRAAVAFAGLWMMAWAWLAIRLMRATRRRRVLMAALHRASDELHEAQEIARVGSWRARDDAVDLSPEAARILGLQDTRLSIDALTGMMVEPDREVFRQAWSTLGENGEAAEVDYRIVAGDGTRRTLRGRGRRVRENGGMTSTGTVQDITEQVERRRRQEDAERQYRFLFDRNPMPLLVFRRDTLAIEAVNDAAVALYGYTKDELRGMTLRDLRPAEDIPALERDVALGATGDALPAQWRHRRRDGTLLDVVIHATSLEFEGREARLVLVEDVTERLRRQQDMAWQMNHDPVTGLLNRAGFLACVEDALATAPAHRGGIAVFYVDLLQFSVINDTLGHAVGDGVLREVGARLEERMPRRVARIYGDEFAVMLPPGADLDATAGAILEALSRPVMVDDTLHYLTAYVGSAAWPHDGESPETLLGNAALANHETRRTRNERFARFAPELARSIGDRRALVSRLHQAIADDEFVLHFQPLYAADDGRPVGLEALVRWVHPERGLVPPGEFIPACESSGLIVPLGRWVLREAARHLPKLQAAGWPDLKIAVNVSAPQFQSGDLVGELAGLFAEYDLPRGAIELELTESLLMHDPQTVIEQIRRLRALGACVAIDDFGTGFSSLQYLNRLPLDKLKIDRSFVNGVGTDRASATICSSVLGLAKSFGIGSVAEGVETQAQLDWLRERGCDTVQGFLLGRPMPFDAVLAHLESSRP